MGRRKELKFLGSEYSARRSSFVVLYGRRRVGKSELLLKFLRSRSGLYYVGKTTARAMQAREFGRLAAQLVGEPLLASLPPEDWRMLLEETVKRYRGSGKLVIVLDEFQWLVEAVPELPGILQELWDTQWKPSGKIMLIVCGSYLGFMEREVLGRKSPLHGRRTSAIKLAPFSLVEAAEFHPHWSRDEQALAYFICGGVPLYLASFDGDLSVRQNVENTLLSEFAPLFREPDFLLREELSELENYYAVLSAIADGYVMLKTIAERTEIGRGSVHYYTQTLSELGYLKKRHPLSVLGRVNTRHLRFAINDPLLRFWFTFVLPNQSSILQLGPRKAFSAHVKPRLEAFAGHCFEGVCRERMPVLYARENVAARFEVGEYWNKHVQIDVVGLRDDRATDLGECKWGPVRSVAGLRKEMEAKAKQFPNQRGATIKRRFFVRQLPRGPNPTPGESWISLEDLYASEG